MKFSVEVFGYFTVIKYNFTEQLLRNSKKNAAELNHFDKKLLFPHSQFLQRFPFNIPLYQTMMSDLSTVMFLSENDLCN